jgi:ribosomal protein L19E
MGKSKGKKGGKVARLPKKECCVSRTKCGRCPLRMLKEGTLPEGYTVKKRKLVKVKKKVGKQLAA